MWLQNQACSRVGGSGGGLRGIRTSEDDFGEKITSSSLAPTRFYENHQRCICVFITVLGLSNYHDKGDTQGTKDKMLRVFPCLVLPACDCTFLGPLLSLGVLVHERGEQRVPVPVTSNGT